MHGAKPAVLEAVNRYYQRTNANVHRGVHTLAERATASYEKQQEKATNLYKRFPQPKRSCLQGWQFGGLVRFAEEI